MAARLGIEGQPTWGTVRQYLLAQGNRRSCSATRRRTHGPSLLILIVLYVAFLLIELGSLPGKLANLSEDPAAVARLERSSPG